MEALGWANERLLGAVRWATQRPWVQSDGQRRGHRGIKLGSLRTMGAFRQSALTRSLRNYTRALEQADGFYAVKREHPPRPTVVEHR